MSKKIINVQFHEGGISTDPKRGIPNSCAYSSSLDFRKRPSELSVLPRTTKISGSVVVDLVMDMCQVPNGDRYMIGNTGKFYRVDTANAVTLIHSFGVTSSGLLYRADTDMIYITHMSSVSTYGLMSGTPAISANKISWNISTVATKTGGAQTYTTPVAISEAANVIASKTIANASLVNGTLNGFNFGAVYNLLVMPNARNYHFHVTSTVADGTVQTATAGNLATADYQIAALSLESPTNNLHPIAQFIHLTCIGNRRYLTTHEPIQDAPSNLEWLRHRLTFPPGYEVCGLATTDEFIAIACGKRSSTGSRDFQDGKIFAWDGMSTTYNFFVDVPMGEPQSIFTYNNLTYFVADGSLYVWPGGKRIYKVRTLADTDSTYTGIADQTYTNPNMATVRHGMMLLGFPSYTTNTNVEHSVYSWGALDKNYPDSFGNNYHISTGTKNNTSGNLKMGMVKNFGDTLYISWQDGAATFGVDVVNNNSLPADTFTWESLVVDAGVTYKQKLANRIRITTEALPTGTLIYPKVKIDRGSWVVSGTPMVAGDKSIVWNLPNGSLRFYEAQFGFDGTYAGATKTPPKILSIAFEFDSLNSEKDV